MPWTGLWTFAALFVVLAVIAQATIEHADGMAPVTLVVDGASRRVRTRCSTVGEVLDDVGVVTRDWDRVMPGRDTPVQARMEVVVQHATAVTIVADGAVETVHTHARDVRTILSQAGLSLRPGDRLWVDGRLLADDLTGLRALSGVDDQGEGTSTALLADDGLQLRPALVRAISSRGSPSSRAGAPISSIEVERATLIYLSDGGVEQALRTTSRTVGQALLQAGVPLYLGDRVHPSLNTQVTTGLRVHIQRGVPVSIAVDGRAIRARTHRKTVSQVLAEFGVSLVGKDYVLPPLDTEVEDNLQMRVVRIAERTIVEEETIPFQTDWIPDPSLELDHRRVDDVGNNGLRRWRYKAVYQDGHETERYLEDEWIAQEPRSRSISYGTHIVIRTLETPDGPIEYWRRMRVFLTSYTEATCGKTPDDPWYGLTRLGWRMRHGIVAVDPRVIRLRSQLYVPGYGRGVAGDTGGMITGRHIDLGHDVDNFVMYFRWGYVYVLTPVPPVQQIRWILPDFPRERRDGGVSSFAGP